MNDLSENEGGRKKFHRSAWKKFQSDMTELQNVHDGGDLHVVYDYKEVFLSTTWRTYNVRCFCLVFVSRPCVFKPTLFCNNSKKYIIKKFVAMLDIQA